MRKTTTIICDGHIHIYSFFDFAKSLEMACRNLGALAAGSKAISAETTIRKMCVLAERYDCHVFAEILDGRLALPEGYSIESCSNEQEIVVSRAGQEQLSLIPGRQIATKERLELLSWGSDKEIPDGVPFNEGASIALSSGALPVLNWAPGKWLFSRSKSVSEILNKWSPSELLVCDTAIRPSCWLEPLAMKAARGKGFQVIAGSDPFPINGEEKRIGSYGFLIEADAEAGCVFKALKSALAAGACPRRTGRRLGPLGVCRRILELKRQKGS